MRSGRGAGAVRRFAWGAFAAALLATTAARADGEPDGLFSKLGEPADDSPTPTATDRTTKLVCMPPGYFNGIGSCCRLWEARLDTSFDTNRVFTGRLELSRAFVIRPSIAIVGRVDGAMAASAAEGNYVLKGPIVSLGLRNQTQRGNYWTEAGVKLVPGYEGPSYDDPSSQRIALNATFSSGLADDARWLPISDTGLQVYGVIQNRTNPRWYRGWESYVGAIYGLQASLWPMKVRSWLGPQSGFIGNTHVDLFVGLPHIGYEVANLQIGLHGELSLSTIWPADRPFPMLGGAFVGWSPEYWFSGRIFAGVAGSPGYTQADYQYGVRLEFFVPGADEILERRRKEVESKEKELERLRIERRERERRERERLELENRRLREGRLHGPGFPP